MGREHLDGFGRRNGFGLPALNRKPQGDVVAPYPGAPVDAAALPLHRRCAVDPKAAELTKLRPDAGSEHQGASCHLSIRAQRSSADDRRCIDRHLTDTVLLGRQAVPDGNLSASAVDDTLQTSADRQIRSYLVAACHSPFPKAITDNCAAIRLSEP